MEFMFCEQCEGLEFGFCKSCKNNMQLINSAKESYDMLLDDDSPLNQIAKDVVRGFFVGVFDPIPKPTVIPINEWVDLDSKFIQSAKYEDLERIFKVMIGERVYFHYEVPQSVFEEFMLAESKGSYYNKNVRGKYE